MSLPRINVYRCEYGCNTVTIDVDDGVTPFMIGCRSRSTPERPIEDKYLDADGFCTGSATSCFYPKTPLPSYFPQPKWEWFKPTESDLRGMTKREADHYRAHPGELALRPRTNAEPMFHPETPTPNPGEEK